MLAQTSLKEELLLACESFEEPEGLVEYLVKHDSDQRALYEEAIALPDYCKIDLVEQTLGSHYNVFVPWFKAYLKHLTNSEDEDLAFTVNDLLDFYKESFSKVEDLNLK